MVMMGAEEQIIDDPVEALAEYRRNVPGAETHLIAGSGHSPNVEKPAQAAQLVLAFAKSPQSPQGVAERLSGTKCKPHCSS